MEVGSLNSHSINHSDSRLFENVPDCRGDESRASNPFGIVSGAGGEGSMSKLYELAPAGSRTVDDVLQAIKDALDSQCPEVVYECLEKRFRLKQADLQMEVEVRDGEGEIPPGLHVRKLSGDHTHYAALCKHLLSCVNN